MIEISEQGAVDPIQRRPKKSRPGVLKIGEIDYLSIWKNRKTSRYLYLKLEPVQRTERIHESAVRRRGELDEQLGPAGRGHWNGLAGSAEPQQNRISGRVPVVNGHKVRHVVTLAPVLQTR